MVVTTFIVERGLVVAWVNIAYEIRQIIQRKRAIFNPAIQKTWSGSGLGQPDQLQ